MENYQKYRWFVTSSGKTVVGGKNAVQNDELLSSLKEEYIIMHTSEPGSPFTVILSDADKITKSDIEECAVFTGCFSKAWKSGKKKTSVDIFRAHQIQKTKAMKTGTWGVSGDVKRVTVDLCLSLIKQKGVLRAVPPQTAGRKSILDIIPGKIDKKDMIPKLQIELNGPYSQEEILSALPAGGIKIAK